MPSTGSTRASTSSGSAPPFSASFAEASPHRLETTLDRAGNRVVERDVAPGRGDDLGDPAAHLTGTDDEHVLEIHGERLTSAAHDRSSRPRATWESARRRLAPHARGIGFFAPTRDELNARLAEAWLVKGPRPHRLLKTDLFDEAVG